MTQISSHAFVVTQVGDKNTTERKRADEISDYVVKPVLEEFGLELRRADRDPTPGQITPQMLRSLLEAEVVIADLTGRNANVYYEVAVAHSFSKPVVMLADHAKSVAFDVKDERLIELGDYEGVLSVPQAEEAKKKLRDALTVVLVEGFVPSSVVAEVAAARSIDQLAPDNPMASELSAIREGIEEIRANLRPRQIIPRSFREDLAVLRAAVERWVEEYDISPEELEDLITQNTSGGFDEWVREMIEEILPSSPDMDEVPF